MVERDRRSQRLEAGEVLVDRPHADGAAAGQRHPGVAESGDEGTEHQDARSHRLDEVVAGVVVGGGVVAPEGDTACGVLAADPEVGEEPPHGTHVLHLRQTHELDDTVAKQCRRHRRKGRVLRPGSADRSTEARGAYDLEAVHDARLPITTRGVPA